MTRRRIAIGSLVGLLGAAGLSAALVARARAHATLGVAEILARNEAARGGLEAWAKVETMAWSGHAERGGGAGPWPQFRLDQKRPNRARFEIVVEGQTSVRVFDGEQGWKVRPGSTGRPEVQPYDEDERRAALDAPGIDGPVLGAQAKGIQVTLDGVDDVEGRRAYRLRTKLPSGSTQRVWIDAESFLELEYERPGRDAAGKPTTVVVFLRDYQAFQGLQIPLILETRAPGGTAGDKLVIERIAVNPNLPDGVFARPGLRTARRGITVDTRAAASGPATAPVPWPRLRAAPGAAGPAVRRGGSVP